MQSEHDLIEDCKYYNLKLIEKKVQFSKTDFVDKQIRANKHEDFVEEKLKNIFLPEVLLLKIL